MSVVIGVQRVLVDEGEHQAIRAGRVRVGEITHVWSRELAVVEILGVVVEVEDARIPRIEHLLRRFEAIIRPSRPRIEFQNLESALIVDRDDATELGPSIQEISFGVGEEMITDRWQREGGDRDADGEKVAPVQSRPRPLESLTRDASSLVSADAYAVAETALAARAHDDNLFDRVARRLARDAELLPPYMSLASVADMLEELDGSDSRRRLDESLRLALRLRVLLPLRAARLRARLSR